MIPIVKSVPCEQYRLFFAEDGNEYFRNQGPEENLWIRGDGGAAFNFALLGCAIPAAMYRHAAKQIC